MEENIRLFKLYIFLYRLEMWIPVQILLLLSKGFSLTQVTLLDSMWYLSTVVFEVPTGTITDRFGKKISFLIAAITKTISLLFLAFGNTFLEICIAEILWGFSSSFETGTIDAFLFDSLKHMDRENDFTRIRGRVTTLSILAAAIGSVAAGYLGVVHISVPIAMTAVIALLTCPLILSFKEPVVTTQREPSYHNHIRESFRFILDHNKVGLLILYSAIMGAGIWAMHLFYQPLMRSYDISIERIGVLYLLFRLIAAVGAYSSDSIYKSIGRTAITIIPLCFVVSVFALGIISTPWSLGFIFPIFFTNGFYFPVIRDLLNQSLPSGKRATIISTGAMISCLLSTIINPLLGKLADSTSLQLCFLVLGWATLIAMTFILVSLNKQLNLQPDSAHGGV